MKPRAVSPSVPESLRDADLQPVWGVARRHLDRHGQQRRGSVSLPQISPASELALKSLLGRVTQRLDLGQLEAALIDREIGDDLSDALTRLGHPPSPEAAQRRAARARSTAARSALEEHVESWNEPWANAWAAGIVKARLLGSLDGEEVDRLVSNVRRLLDFLDQNGPGSADIAPYPGDHPGRTQPQSPIEAPRASRTELAAALFGSSHALDPGTRLASFVSRALRCRLDADLEGRELWEASGIQPDRVSAPALAWAIPAAGKSALDALLRGATEGRLPAHVSLLALQRHPVRVPSETPVLVVENPRLVEAAAERGLRYCVVSTNGNPSTAVTTLLDQIRLAGASLWYHGDFDASGIAICRRMRDSGCTPWMMGVSHYEDAIRRAERNGVRLARDTKRCGPTPWDPRLETTFDDLRLIVHEEFILDPVLESFLLRPSPRASSRTLR